MAATAVGSGALGGTPATGAVTQKLSMQLLQAVASVTTTASGLPSDPHRRKELTHVCVCLFFGIGMWSLNSAHMATLTLAL